MIRWGAGIAARLPERPRFDSRRGRYFIFRARGSLKKESGAMPATDVLEKDSSGMIVTRPVLGWTTVPVADTA
jgi:hypothetical protein